MPRDFWIGLVTLGFAVLYWLEAAKIRISPLDGPVGASGLPKTLAWALGTLSVLLILKAVAEKLRAAPAAPGAGPQEGFAARMHTHLRALGMLGIGVAYVVLLPFLGYALSIMLLLATTALYIGGGLTLRTGAFMVGGAIFYYALFVAFLGIPLPDGMILDALTNGGK